MALVKIITGGINSGKTTTVRRLEAEYRQRGLRTAGFISEAEYSDGEKTSYSLRDIETGGRILSVAKNIPPTHPEPEKFCRYDFSRFYFYKPAFDAASVRIVEIINSSEADSPDVLFIDEIGPLELSGNGHYQAVKELIAGYCGILILVIREGVLDELLGKLGLGRADVEFVRKDARASSQRS